MSPQNKPRTSFIHSRRRRLFSIVLFISIFSVGLKLSSTAVTYPSQTSANKETITTSFFGMHIHHMVVPSGKNPLTPWPDTQVYEWRLWDCYTMWPYLEPAKGQWNFNTLDKSLELAEQHNVGVILTLGLTPQWASARPTEPSSYQPGFAAEPKDMADWQNFVRTVATRYRGRIHLYEVGNEPNLKIFWTGTTEQMVEMTQMAHDIIKSIDPSALIISPSATGTNGISWLADFLAKGGGQYVDIIGYHLYVTPKPPEAMVPLAQQVKLVMAQHGVSNKPLWDTESGWMPPSQFGSGDLGAGYVLRSYLMVWSQGVQRFYWYAWDNHSAMSLQMTTSNSETPTDAGRAYLVTQEWLLGSSMDWCTQSGDQTWSCQLNHEGNLRWIVWNPNQTKTITIPAAWKIKHVVPMLANQFSLEGNSVEVGPTPVLLRSY